MVVYCTYGAVVRLAMASNRGPMEGDLHVAIVPLLQCR